MRVLRTLKHAVTLPETGPTVWGLIGVALFCMAGLVNANYYAFLTIPAFLGGWIAGMVFMHGIIKRETACMMTKPEFDEFMDLIRTDYAKKP